jgi:hypothetical protein
VVLWSTEAYRRPSAVSRAVHAACSDERVYAVRQHSNPDTEVSPKFLSDWDGTVVVVVVVAVGGRWVNGAMCGKTTDRSAKQGRQTFGEAGSVDGGVGAGRVCGATCGASRHFACPPGRACWTDDAPDRLLCFQTLLLPGASNLYRALCHCLPR